MSNQRAGRMRSDVLHDVAGNPIDVLLVGGVRRLAVDASLTVSEIQIGAVELDDGAGATRASIKSNGVALSPAPNDGGLLISGSDGANQRHVLVDAAGRLVTAPVGGGANTFTGNAPQFATVGVASATHIPANPARKWLSITVTTPGRRVSLGMGANPAVLDSGTTLVPFLPAVLDASGITQEAIQMIANVAGTNVSWQEGV